MLTSEGLLTYRETYSFAEGNALAKYGSLGMLGQGVPDGGEELYRERLRAELMHAIEHYGLIAALAKVLDINPGDLR